MFEDATDDELARFTGLDYIAVVKWRRRQWGAIEEYARQIARDSGWILGTQDLVFMALVRYAERLRK